MCCDLRSARRVKTERAVPPSNACSISGFSSSSATCVERVAVADGREVAWRTAPWRGPGRAGSRSTAGGQCRGGYAPVPRYTFGNFSAMRDRFVDPRPPEVRQHELRVAEVERGAIDGDRAAALARHEPARGARLHLRPARRRRRTRRRTGSSRRGRGGGRSCGCGGSSRSTHGSARWARMSRTPRMPCSGSIERERGEAAGPAGGELLDLLPAGGDVLEVVRIERAVTPDVAGGEQHGGDAELVHAVDHDPRARRSCRRGRAAPSRCDAGRLERAVPDREPVGRERRCRGCRRSAAGRQRSSRNRFSLGERPTPGPRVERAGRDDLGGDAARRAGP